jgi:chorismate mutase/prephenate dehydratase
MTYVTFLGPVGATFSHDACLRLMEAYHVPREREFVAVGTNGDILPSVCAHGGYGVVAMDTLAEGRVTEPLESFIDLLRIYQNEESCPIHVIGAVQMRLHFNLMVRQGMSRESITRVIAHPKSFGACREWVKERGWPVMHVSSNGEAARLIAEQGEYATCASLGPKSASERFNLPILEEGCEDQTAITTFFLIGPKNHPISVGEKNRILIVFSVPHTSNALAEALLPLGRHDLNMIQIHSVHVGNHTYHFAIELEANDVKHVEAVKIVVPEFNATCTSSIVFGPFEVLSL